MCTTEFGSCNINLRLKKWKHKNMILRRNSPYITLSAGFHKTSADRFLLFYMMESDDDIHTQLYTTRTCMNRQHVHALISHGTHYPTNIDGLWSEEGESLTPAVFTIAPSSCKGREPFCHSELEAWDSLAHGGLMLHRNSVSMSNGSEFKMWNGLWSPIWHIGAW